MDALWRDVRVAVRGLLRAPTFAVVAVLTLGLGIGANTAIFSVVDGVLLSGLPYERSEELVTVWLDQSAADGPVREWFTPADLQDFRNERGLFAELGGWGGWSPTLTGLGEPEVVTAAVVTHGMLDGVLGVQPPLGRAFMPEEDAPQAAGTVILSHSFWMEHFAGDRGVLGRPVILNEQPFSVVGVMPEGFRAPFVPEAELWAPARLDPAQCGRGCYTIRGMGRLAPGVSIEVARERASALAARLAEAFPETNALTGAAIFDLREEMIGDAGRALWVLLGAVGFVLMIACTNVANLLLSRGATREGEFAVRVALGAGRPTIVRQLLTESLILASLGGLLGVGLAAWGTEVLVSLAPVALPGLDDVALDGRVLGFTIAVSLLTGLLFGLAPALRTGRADVYRGVARGRTAGGLGRSVRSAMVVTQIAMAMVLLVGAGLLMRSFQELNQVDLGFEPEGVLTVGVGLPVSRFDDAASRITFYHDLLGRLEALPGVIAAGGTASLPLSGSDGDADFRIEGQEPPRPPAANVAWNRPITRGYFYTMGQALLDGREFDEGDDAEAPRVVIVNEELARRHFDYPERSPVGSRVAFGSGEWRTIVGVAADTRHFAIQAGPRSTRPAMYFPYEQVTRAGMTMVLRTDGDPTALTADVRAAVAAIDPGLAASRIIPMTDVVAGQLVTERFVTTLLGLFAVLALALATVGLYGVVSYGVEKRLREMGIRLALGAGGGSVRAMVVRGAMSLVAIGVVVGVVGAWGLTRVIEALLYGVQRTDPATFAITVLALTGVALVAAWVPARRAGSVDPVAIMREE